MPGAERHRRLDQQRLAALRNLVGIVASIDKKAPRLDRAQIAPHLGDPVHLRQFRHGEGARAVRRRQEVEPHRVGGRLVIGPDLPQPRSVLHLERADPRRRGLKLFQRLRERLGAGLVTQRGDGGPCGHRVLPRYSAGVGKRPENTVSCPGSGWRGIISASISDTQAMPAASTNTAAGDTSHRYPSAAGRNTAAMWLMVNATAAVGAMSPGSAIFWK